MTALKEKFYDTIRPELKKTLSFTNIERTPKVTKVVVSSGVGKFKEEEKAIEKIQNDLAIITGQKPKINKSRKAVSAFKLRIGQPVGLTVTLRGEKMYDFIFRLANVALPRVRDFKGLSRNGFDGRGNYSLGISEHTIMPEIKFENVTENFGFQINVNTTAKNNAECEALLSALGFPFEKQEGSK
ncbi:MAG: 50S ribosomal protein L5 [Patescibacteria group bacterium]|jgi:large subunit ribosomal protein L5